MSDMSDAHDLSPSGVARPRRLSGPATAPQTPDWPNLPPYLLVHMLAQCMSPYDAAAARRVCRAWLANINAAIRTIALSLSQLEAVAKFPALRHLMLEGGWGGGAAGPGTAAWQQALAALNCSARLQSLELSHCDELLVAMQQCSDGQTTPLGSLRSLIVRNSALSNPPEWISQLTGLTELVVEHSGAVQGRPPAMKHFLQWTEAAAQLTGLRRLRISNVVSAKLLPGVSALQGLTQLHLIRSLQPLPVEMGALTGLQELNLAHTHVAQLPGMLTALTGLTRLCLRGCQGLMPQWLLQQPLQPQPPVLPQLTALKHLQHLDLALLDGQGLAAVPKSVSALTALTALDLSGAGLFDSMSRLQACTALQELRLVNTRGLELPEGFTALQRLQLLDCSGSHAPLSDVLLRLPALEEVTCDEQHVSQHLWERLHCKGVTVTLVAPKVESMVDEDGEEHQEMALYDDDAEPWAEEGFC